MHKKLVGVTLTKEEIKKQPATGILLGQIKFNFPEQYPDIEEYLIKTIRLIYSYDPIICQESTNLFLEIISNYRQQCGKAFKVLKNLIEKGVAPDIALKKLAQINKYSIRVIEKYLQDLKELELPEDIRNINPDWQKEQIIFKTSFGGNNIGYYSR